MIADDVLRDRQVVLSRLRRKGIYCIDTTAADVSADLINRYLDIKRRELV